ncbi:hypothetical protein ACS0TY_018408 [Phlomoides rotata]
MASMVAENWDQMDGHDDSNNFELSPRNHNLLMSLLDETQFDECDDERLKHVIRSLEAEIDSTSHFAFDDGTWASDVVDCESSINESYGLNSSTIRDDLDFRWMDIDIVPSSPSGDMDHLQGHGNEIGWLNNFPYLEADQDYGSLWHETNAINHD